MASATHTCILCGNTGLTKAHYVPRAVREVLPEQKSSFTIMPEGSGSITQPVISLTEKAYGRGPFDTQPRVLCGRCNSAWMTPYEDQAGPLLAAMITSSAAQAVTQAQAHAVATWAVTAMMIRSTADNAIQRLAPDLMLKFREHGVDAIDAQVAVFSFAHTRTFFAEHPVGSTYVFDADEPERNAQVLIFLQKIVVVVSIGKFGCNFERAIRLFSNAVVLSWPATAPHQGWPTRGEVLDNVLLPVLGLEDQSRSRYIPATPIRRSDGTRRTVIRLPKAFTSAEITSDQQLIMAMRAFEEIVRNELASYRAENTSLEAP